MSKVLSCLGCAFVFLVSSSMVAFAAEKNEAAYAMPAVTVTAQKRDENIQQVPSSVGVVSSQQIEERRITTFSDLNKAVPNLYIGDSGPGTYSYFGIRGRINGSMDVDPTVTVLVDGVPYDDFFTVSGLPLFDVERIEVLRGPQSTMYGMNSAAGVINVVTKKPGNTPYIRFGMEGNGGYKSDLGGLIRASAGGPLIEDKLAAGVSLLGNRTGGYITNKYNDDSLGGSETFAGRIATVFTPTDAFDATLNFGAYKINTDNGFLTLPTTSAAARIIGQSKRKWKADYNEAGNGSIDSMFGDLNMHVAAPVADLYSITAFRKAQQKFTTERDGTSYDGITTYNPTTWAMDPLKTNIDGKITTDTRTFTQEFRIQSLADNEGPLEWLAGFFYHDFSRDLKGTVNRYDMMTPPDFVMMDNTLDGSNYAVFGQATYRVLDKKLGFTVGLRQEWTEREVNIHDAATAAAFGTDTLSGTDSMLLPKFGIDYRITPEAMVYATVAKGWRTGGVTSNISFVTKKKDAKYDAETSWTYEIGAKTEWLDKRLLLNVAGFHTIYKDFQDEVMTDPTVGGYLSNSGKTRISGFEIEAVGRITENLTATVDFGYLHARYKDYETYGADYAGNTVAAVPEFTLDASLQYNFMDGFYVRPGVRVIGKTYWDRANTQKQAPYATLNLRAGYQAENFDVYMYGDNLTNKYAFSHAAEGMWGPEYYYGTPVRPLQIGVGFNIYF